MKELLDAQSAVVNFILNVNYARSYVSPLRYIVRCQVNVCIGPRIIVSVADTHNAKTGSIFNITVVQFFESCNEHKAIEFYSIIFFCFRSYKSPS